MRGDSCPVQAPAFGSCGVTFGRQTFFIRSFWQLHSEVDPHRSAHALILSAPLPNVSHYVCPAVFWYEML